MSRRRVNQQDNITKINLKNSFFGMDALSKKTALRVLEKGVDYILMVKGNQKGLHEWLQELIWDASPNREEDGTTPSPCATSSRKV